MLHTAKLMNAWTKYFIVDISWFHDASEKRSTDLKFDEKLFVSLFQCCSFGAIILLFRWSYCYHVKRTGIPFLLVDQFPSQQSPRVLNVAHRSPLVEPSKTLLHVNTFSLFVGADNIRFWPLSF